MGDDRAAEGFEHLQAAALELIAAARAFLDVAEDLVSDPERVSGAAGSWVALIDLVLPARAPQGTGSGGGAGGSGRSTGEGETRRIRRLDLS